MLPVLRGVFALNKIRARFSRGEEVKYISHLDTMRTFERTVRRAGIPIAYSHGFNPRPQMSFGLPLSVGVTSNYEYIDMEMEGDLSAQDLIEKLNNNLPRGFSVQNAEYINTTGSLMASIGVASYEVSISNSEIASFDQIKGCVDSIMGKEALLVEKESKGKIKNVDIRPYIYELKINELNNGQMSLSMNLSAGSEFNVKPELVVKVLNEVCTFPLKIVKIHRIGLFGKEGKALL